MKRDTCHRVSALNASIFVKLCGVEVGVPDFYPAAWMGGIANATAVAISDMVDFVRKLLARLTRMWRYALTGTVGNSQDEECEANDDGNEKPVHANFFNGPSLTFFFRSARTNLSHLAMPARFSGM